MGEIATLISALAGVAAVVVSVVVYISAQGKNLRDLIQSGDKGALSYADTLAAQAAKARHDSNGRLANDLAGLERDIETLKREAVRREDLNAVDSRWAGMFVRLETKLDRQGEQLAELAALKATLSGCVDRLGEVMKRLDTREARS